MFMICLFLLKPFSRQRPGSVSLVEPTYQNVIQRERERESVKQPAHMVTLQPSDLLSHACKRKNKSLPNGQLPWFPSNPHKQQETGEESHWRCCEKRKGIDKNQEMGRKKSGGKKASLAGQLNLPINVHRG